MNSEPPVLINSVRLLSKEVDKKVTGMPIDPIECKINRMKQKIMKDILNKKVS